ncbi:MAG: hypothetical protein R3Y54_13340 [Eubacteriales bacterium]
MTRFISIENQTDIPLEKAVLVKEDDFFSLNVKTDAETFDVLGSFSIRCIKDCNDVRHAMRSVVKEDLFIFIEGLSVSEKMLLGSI